MAEEDTMRLVAEVVDKFSGPLKDMQKQMRALSDMSRGVHVTGAKSTEAHAKAYEELNHTLERTKKGIESSFGPALETLGITATGVGGAIAGVVESVRRLGDSYNVLNDASKRSGLQIDSIRAVQVAWERLGVAPERAAESVARFGELMDKTSRGAPGAAERWAQLGGAFQALDVSKLLTLPREQQLDKIVDYLATHKIPIDQKRKFFEQILSLPPELATKSAEEIREALEAGYKFTAAHPYPKKIAEDADRAFAHLRETIQGVGIDLAVAFGGDTVKFIDGLIDDINRAAKTLIEFGAEVRRLRSGDYSDLMPELIPGGLADRVWNASKQLSIQGVHDAVYGRSPQATLWENMLHTNRGAILAGRATSGLAPGALSMQGVHDSVFGHEQKQSIYEGTLRALREWWTGESGEGAHGGEGGDTGSSPLFRPGVGPRARGGGGGAGVDVPSRATGGTRRTALGDAASQWASALNPTAAAAALGNILPESSGNPNSRHFDQPRFRGTEAGYAHGLYQFGGTEWNDYSRWLTANHPGRAWQDPHLQTEFLIDRLKNSKDPRYRALWSILKNLKPGEEGKGAMAFQKLYERPKVLQGQRATTAERIAPQIGDLIKDANRSDTFGPGGPKPLELLKLGAQSGLLGGGQTVTGDASLSIDLNGFPRGTKTATNYSGMFKEVRLNRGRPMAVASEEA